ncbi:reverse transcriptase domain-containing protein, partial [Nanoarchaeota archaeon]
MRSYKYLYESLTSLENLELAYKKARKHKTNRDYVVKFEENLDNNLLLLHSELLLHCYKPKLLVTFIIHDPKTRKISKSDFRDRVVHHTLVNILEPIFESRFITDTYASRKGKGTLAAIKKFDYFKRKISRNNTRLCYVFKADIKKYFENVDHKILINTIKKKIKDNKVLWLIKTILNNTASRE